MAKTIREIIMLGAGASKPDGAPLQKELFKEFFDYYQARVKNKVWAAWQDKEDLIIAFFQDFWGIDIKSYRNDKVDFPTFEECLGMLDLAYVRGESLKGYNRGKIVAVRNALIFMIALMLDEKLRSQAIYQRKLIARLKQKSVLSKIGFISLNYDIIIDNALSELYDEFHIDYGIELVNYNRKDDFKRPISSKSVLLLKLHGSLNWLYCPTCVQIERTPQKATEAFYTSKPCRDCQTPMKPVIIPPSFYKEMSNPFIQEIFLTCDKILRNVIKIYICGYSFPDADMHIKYLLKRAEIYRGKTPEIIVINSYKGKSDYEKSIEKLHYMRFFSNRTKVHYTDSTFEDFCEHDVS